MQPLVALGTNNPYDHVVSPIGCRDPGRSLSVLAYTPRKGDGERIWINLVSLNCVAVGAENEVGALAGCVRGRGLTPDYTVNA